VEGREKRKGVSGSPQRVRPATIDANYKWSIINLLYIDGGKKGFAAKSASGDRGPLVRGRKPLLLYAGTLPTPIGCNESCAHVHKGGVHRVHKRSQVEGREPISSELRGGEGVKGKGGCHGIDPFAEGEEGFVVFYQGKKGYCFFKFERGPGGKNKE